MRVGQALARIKLDRPDADVAVFARDLGEDARAVYAFASDRDAGATEALLNKLKAQKQLIS